MNGYAVNIGNSVFIFNLSNVICAGLLALVITFVITSYMRLSRILKTAPIITAKLMEVREVIERCHAMFPIESVVYHGVTFERGMDVKITLSDKKSFIGQFVGVNDRNMVCVITPKSIVTQDLRLIKDLVLCEEQGKA